MKKLLTILLVTALMLIPTVVGADAPANRLEKILAEGKITMVTAPGFPPFEFMDMSAGEDNVIGCDISLGKYIAEQLGVELVIETMDFSTVLAAIGQGTADIAISGMVPKEDRAAVMDFSTPYNTDGYHSVVVRAEDLEKYASFNDFEGQVVLAQNGSLQQTLVEEQVPGAKMELVTTVGDGIMMVKTGKAAGIAISGVVGELYIKSYPDLAILEEHFDYDTVGTVVGIVKGEAELVEAVSKIVEEAETSGLYAQWRDEANTIAAAQMIN